MNVVENQIHTTVKQAESFIDEIGTLIIRDGGTVHMAEQRQLKIMRGICNGTGGCNSISIVNPSGISIANSAVFGAPNIDVSDRPYFTPPNRQGRFSSAPP